LHASDMSRVHREQLRQAKRAAELFPWEITKTKVTGQCGQGEERGDDMHGQRRDSIEPEAYTH